MNKFSNLLNGSVNHTAGTSYTIKSPVDHSTIGEGLVLPKEIINEVFRKSRIVKNQPFELKGLAKLAKYIDDKKDNYVNQIILDIGYTKKDALDIVEGSVELVKYFNKFLMDTKKKNPDIPFSYVHKGQRKLQIITKPYGIVSAMTPQNAPLILELSVILNVLASGNSLVLRPSSQCVGTISLLIEALVASFPKEQLERISIISCKATDFLEASYSDANLIHYIGSTSHGINILNNAIANNITALVDGEGNSIVVIDKTASIEEAVRWCRDGIIRCSGELCSTIRAIVVEQSLHKQFSEKLIAELKKVKIGNPILESVDMGPLFHSAQAQKIIAAAQKYTVIAGDTSPHKSGENYIQPILCALKSADKQFLNEPVYGPITGIAAYKGDEWKDWLKATPYKLNEAVLSNDSKFIDDFIANSTAPRIVINNDPSIESVFEPWGGYLPGGFNTVSTWYDKYCQTVQIDTKL